MTRRHGIGSIEMLLLAIFLLMLGATLLMVWQFSRHTDPATLQGKDLVGSYEKAVETLARDTRMAVSFLAGREHLTLETASGTSVEWGFTDNALRRSQAGQPPEILVEGLREGGFTTASATPDFFSIWMIPAEAGKMPLFTSFALRGGRL
ncbi:MAG TPA: hypothetical protein VIV61_04785 [Candidatus Ozemobacteraceae bacterium]|jgi:hypothetical protein